jgi:transposase, IS4 family protein
MYTRFVNTKNGTLAYIQKSVRVDGYPRTITVKCLGLLSDIQKEHGCADPRKWVQDLAATMTAEEKESRGKVTLELSPSREIAAGERPLRHGGDLMLLGLYNRLGLPEVCGGILKGCRARYDLNGILQTLVVSRILFPCSKRRTMELARDFVKPPRFSENDMFRALSLLSGHIDTIQAEVYRRSLDILPRRDKVVFYDCTNYYFEIEDNDPDVVDRDTGEFVEGLRKCGKSKEHRPNPIVQMGMFMDYDGIPLAFRVFPGNRSEQQSLQPLEEVLNRRFGMTDYVVSTDAGLVSEDNRRYNMAEGREYICVQSIPSLGKADQLMCVRPEGWRIAFRKDTDERPPLDTGDPGREIFNLDRLIEQERKTPGTLKDTTLYKEIVVQKGPAGHKRPERVIVTYDHDFAMYLKHKRAESLARAQKIVDRKQARSRQSQQDPRHYVTTIHKTKKGERAVKIEMAINADVVAQEEELDGFYAYATSLDDEAADVLRIRSFHHEIEHIFRTTKTFLEARPVFLSRQDRIKTHFLVCFLVMVILKMLQRQLTEAYPESYAKKPLSIDRLIDTLRNMRFAQVEGYGYLPMFTRTALTDQLQKLAGVSINTQIIPTRQMTANYRNVKN